MALHRMTFGVRGVDADLLKKGNQALNGDDGANEITAANLIATNALPFQQLLLFLGDANDGDLNIDEGERAFNLSDMAATGRVSSLKTANQNDPVRITAHGLRDGGALGDLTSAVRFDNSRGFGLANGRDGEHAAHYLNRGDSLTFELTELDGARQWFGTLSFTVNTRTGAATSVVIDFDGDVVTNGAHRGAVRQDGIDLGLVDDGAVVSLDFVSRTIHQGGSLRAMSDAEFLAFLTAGMNRVTIGALSTDPSGFSIGGLTIASRDAEGAVIVAPPTGGVTTGSDGADIIVGSGVSDIINAGGGADLVFGGDGADIIDAGAGDDTVEGGAGDDVILAGDGNDLVVGGLGNDTQSGGAGADRFVLKSLDDLSVSSDHIADFESGFDTIDLSAIGGLVFIGQADFGGVAGQVRIAVVGSTTEVQIDANGDGLLDDRVVIDNGRFNLVETARGSLVLEVRPIVGSAGDDVLVGEDAFDDQIRGLGGDDLIQGLGGSDTLHGDGGDDVIQGGGGDDLLIGDGDTLGIDILDGGDGVDTVSYRLESRTIGVFVSLPAGLASSRDGTERDTLVGIENVEGTDFEDEMDGSDDSNVLIGLGGPDFLFGGAGDDVLEGGDGDDALFGELGVDTLFGGAGDDIMNGGAQSDSSEDEFLYGGDGHDFLRSGTGESHIDGGVGFDRLSYFFARSGVVVDLSLQGLAQDTGGGGLDTLVGIEALSGSNFGDTLLGDSVDNLLFGSAGNDVIEGRFGNDILIGGFGSDTLGGGDGVDVASYSVSLVNTSLNGGVFDVRTGGVLVDLFVGFGGALGGGESDTLADIENVEGSIFADEIYGDNNANALAGNGGDDVIFGRAGADLLNGAVGADVLNGGDGADSFVFVAGEANGDTIVDFAGGGGPTGDVLVLKGYGSAVDGAALVQVDPTHWQVTSADGLFSEVIALSNGAVVGAGDFFFG